MPSGMVAVPAAALQQLTAMGGHLLPGAAAAAAQVITITKVWPIVREQTQFAQSVNARAALLQQTHVRTRIGMALCAQCSY